MTGFVVLCEPVLHSLLLPKWARMSLVVALGRHGLSLQYVERVSRLRVSSHLTDCIRRFSPSRLERFFHHHPFLLGDRHSKDSHRHPIAQGRSWHPCIGQRARAPVLLPLSPPPLFPHSVFP